MQEVQQLTRSVLIVGAATLALAAAPTSAPAQQPPAQPPPAQQPTVTSAEVEDEELEQFTKGLIDVMEIQEEAKQELAAAQDAAAAQRVQESATTRMIEAIEERDLTVERYNMIARSLAQDAELSQRFEDTRREIEDES